MALFRRRSGEAGHTEEAGAHMRRALHLVLAGDLGAAELELAEAARVDSSSADVYMALANLYRARGEIGRAIQIHQNLLLQPGLPDELRREALLGLALDFRAGGFLRRAASSFEELLESEPRNLQALRELERLRVESGEWEEAIRIRRRIGSRDPSTKQVLAHLWTGLGRAHDKADREADARKAYKRAVSHDRRCAEAYIALGDQRMRAGKPRKAIGLWERALPLHAAIGQILYPRLWDAYAADGDAEGAERLFAVRLDADPDDRLAALWLARATLRQGRIDDGLGALRRLLNRDPTFLPAHSEIGRVVLAANRDADALKAFEELLGQLPEQAERMRCQSCGTQDTALHWRCPQCGEWDSFV